jgi:hypothetical protein
MPKLVVLTPERAAQIREAYADNVELMAETFRDFTVLEREVAPLPTPLKPPWDYRDGISYVAYPVSKTYRTIVGDDILRTENAIEVFTSSGERLQVGESHVGGFTLDPNWHANDLVDWPHASLQALTEGRPYEGTLSSIVQRIVDNLMHFVDLPQVCSGTPDQVAHLLALWIVGTYLMPIWSAYGYLHFDAPFEASGKSRAATVMSQMSFWPVMVGGNSTVPEWRDSAHFGRTQLFDDVDLGELPPSARNMLHVGYKRATAKVRLKTQKETSGWESLEVDVFTPRIFAVVGTMPPMLRSRTFRISMRKTSRSELAQRDPQYLPWPHDLNLLRGDLYVWAFQRTSAIEARYKSAELNRLGGRNHELARPLLTIASLLDDEQRTNLLMQFEHLLAEMGDENERERAEASGLAAAVLAACKCVEAGILRVRPTEFGQRHEPRLNNYQAGKVLSGVPWAARKLRQGRPEYLLDAQA